MQIDAIATGIQAIAGVPRMTGGAAVEGQPSSTGPSALPLTQTAVGNAPKKAMAGPGNELDKAAERLNDVLKQANVVLKFSQDQDTHATVVQVVDQTTGETLNQFPSVALLHLSASLGKLQGRLFNRKA